jgi:hypothetical protein
MTTLLETTHSNGQEIKIWHSEQMPPRAVLSLILKGYADLIERKFIYPSIPWAQFTNSVAMWVTNTEETIIGGIQFGLDDAVNAGVIQLVFVENEKEYTNEVHGLCVAHIKKIVKQQGRNFLIQQVHMDNQVDMGLASSVGLNPSFYYLSRSLIDD